MVDFLPHAEDSDADKEQGLVVQVDQIFARSAQLNHDAIIDFVTWLCAVSVEELQVIRRQEREREHFVRFYRYMMLDLGYIIGHMYFWFCIVFKCLLSRAEPILACIACKRLLKSHTTI